MRSVVIGQPHGTTADAVSDWHTTSLREIERASYESDVLSGDLLPAYETAAALAKASVPPDKNTVSLLGYYSGGDGGGGTWKRLTPAPSPVKKYHIQSTDGAWWIYSPNDSINLRALGAKGDLSQDDTPYIQAAGDFAVGRWVDCPVGQYLMNSGCTWTIPVNFRGHGHGCGPGPASIANDGCTQFMVNFSAGHVLSVTSNQPSCFEHIQWNTKVAHRPRSSGAAIFLTGPSRNANSSIFNCGFAEQYDCIHFTRPFENSIDLCFFTDWANSAVILDTAAGVEASGGHISRNKFFGDSTAGTTQQFGVSTGIGYTSITGNGFFGAGVGVQLASGPFAAGSLFIENNRFEEQDVAGIVLQKHPSAGAEASMVRISGNQFSTLSAHANHSADIIVYDAAASADWLDTLAIESNVFRNSFDVNKRFIWVQSGTGVEITNNRLENLGAGTSTIGIDFTFAAAGLKDPVTVGNNTFIGTFTPRYATTTTVVVIDPHGQDAANLPTCRNGSMVYASDAKRTSNTDPTVTTPGAGGMCFREGGAWHTNAP